MFRILLALCLALITLTLPAAAQERPRAILVLDASGSMWGQIDGVNKIVIAREVIGDLLKTLPPEQELGLTAYGHRRKGDCNDIETLILPGGDTRAAIASAVNGLQPKGKTPLSAAVIQAAEALKYTEERATVILVSDGKETCDFDPCEVGRKLEAAGVDFTAHVIGFDVSNPADRAQLQCLAEETGGTFRTASNAAELSEALLVVAEPPAPPPPPAPKPFNVTFNAKDGAGGLTISRGLVWTVTDADGATLLQGGTDMTPTLELLPGNYRAAVTRDVDGASAEGGFVVDGHETVVLVLPELPPPPVKFAAYATDGKNGPRINDPLVWDLRRGDGTPVIEAQQSSNLNLELTKGEYIVSVLRPIDESYAEERFGVGTVNKTVTLVLPEYRPLATIEAVDSAVAGSHIDVRWTGPDAKNDFIAVAPVGEDEGSWSEYTYTREGPLLKLRMPAKPGDYEIRYVLDDGRKALARRKITVTPVTATLAPPASLPAGATVSVGWTGPDYHNDYLAVGPRGEDGYINYAYTREGQPTGLQMPAEPGEYDITYVMDQDRTILARVPVTVTGIDFAVTAAATAAAGSAIDVTWKGPDYQNDYIAISPAGSKDSEYIDYTYTREGSPLKLQAPLVPGTYEIRYVLSQDRAVQARTTIEITDVQAGVSGPATAVAGAEIKVDWKGPGYRNDYISLAVPDAKDNTYEFYTYTREGSPLEIRTPTVAGSYELRYFMAGRDGRVLARQPIEITPVSATLQADATVAPGSELTVTWTGPGYRNDYIAISRVGDNGQESYSYTRKGSPLTVKVPDQPGSYELRYVLGQDRRVLQRQPLTVK